MERKNECLMEHNGNRIQVDVFTQAVVTGQELSPLALERGIEFLSELGTQAEETEITLVGYIERGKWPAF